MPKKPETLIGKSLQVTEEIAKQYHTPGKTEIYTLRPALLYGPMIPHGTMIIAKFMYDGLLIGPLENKSQKLATVSGKDLAIAAFLVAMAPNPGHQTFNIASEIVEIESLMKDIAQCIPREKIVGIKTRLANIMQIGYQDTIHIPEKFFRFLGHFTEQITHFMNQVRYEKRIPILNKHSVEYILQVRAISGKRLFDSLGWKPTYKKEHLQKSIEYALEFGWNFTNTLARENFADTMLLYDSVMNMVEELENYSIDSDEYNYFPVPLLGFEIDVKSLWILLERAWSYLLLSFIKGGNKSKLSSTIPSIISSVSENILKIIRYEHSRAKRLYPNNGQQQVKWIFTQIGFVDQKRLKFYATITFLSQIIAKVSEFSLKYKDVLQILPSKNYGLFFASEIGDIGIIFKVKDGNIEVNFPRKNVEAISKSWYFNKRLSEFQKNSKLHIALGVRLEQFFSDIMSGNLIENIKKRFGKEYLLSDTGGHYQFLGKAVSKSDINICAFVNETKKVAFGIKLKDKKLELLEQPYIDMLNSMIHEFNDYKEIINMIEVASSQEEKVAFFRIKTVRQIIGGMIAPSRIKKVIFKLLERAAGI